MKTEDIELHLKSIVCFLECYLPLANAHANDFVIENNWSRFLPDRIAGDLDNLVNVENDQRAIIKLFLKKKKMLSENSELANTVRTRNISLQECAVANGESIPRVVTPPPECAYDKNTTPLWVHDTLEDFLTAAAACTFTNIAFETKIPSNDKAFISHGMGIKKSHEIEIMTEVALSYIPPSPSLVVDIGAGKGYLGTYLNLSYGTDVLEIDAVASNSEGSAKRRQRIQNNWRGLVKKGRELKGMNCDEMKPIEHKGVCHAVTAMVSSGSQLQQLIVDKLNLTDDSDMGLLMTGLHTCGGLANTILKTFVNCPMAKNLLNVGCCYHYLEEKYFHNTHIEKFDSQMPVDFPLSAWMTNRVVEDRFTLARNSRVLAAQSVERLVSGAEMHSSLWYRVILQQYLKDNLGYTSDDWIVGRIAKKCRPNDPLDYFQHGLRSLGFTELAENVTSDDIDKLNQRFVGYQDRLHLFFFLRVCLAPVVETLILLDRLLYLRESGIDNAEIVQLFDAEKSPRCYAIIATKS